MNWLDIVILLLIVISTVIGLRIGIIKAGLSLAGLIIGVILAGLYYIPLSQNLTFIPTESVARVLAFAIILVGVMIVAAVLASLLKWAASAMMLQWINQLGGAVFGLVMGAILCGVLLAIWIKYLDIPDAVTESTLAPILLDYFPKVLALLPDEFDTIKSFF